MAILLKYNIAQQSARISFNFYRWEFPAENCSKPKGSQEKNQKNIRARKQPLLTIRVNKEEIYSILMTEQSMSSSRGGDGEDA
jgi:hypothetical protein